MSIRRLLCRIIVACSFLTAAAASRCCVAVMCYTRVHGLGGRGRRSYRSPLSTHLVLDHAFQGLPQHRDVGGVWFVLQRSEDAPSDGGNVSVARPTGDGEAIRDLDQVPVRIGERVLVIAHRRPRYREPSDGP